MEKDPRRIRLSENFLLSDFLGNHSVYSKGHPNPFEFDKFSVAKLDNVKALCLHGLEPVIAEFGPISISYGYISPDLSRRVVKYQDPDKPSHHRFDLGAACDFVAHEWVAGEFRGIIDLYAPESVVGSPIALAHGIDYLEVPYSRLITYSESPYLCLAVSAKEVEQDKPRKAFYENRYTGVPKAKPDYRTYSTPQARSRALEGLQNTGLEHDWVGAGYPTYHGGGHRQYQHMRVSKYTMVSDWLFDLKSISEGAKNIPALNDETVQDSFAAAGIVYDWMLHALGAKRLSIVSGYVSPSNPNFRKDNDWRENTMSFMVAHPPQDEVFTDIEILDSAAPDGAQFTIEDDFILVMVNPAKVLESTDW